MLVARYQIDLPVWDQWVQVDIIEKLFSGRLGLTDLWQQHNELRQPFSRLITLSLAYLSHWNMSLELTLNLVIGAACFGIYGYQVLSTLKQTESLPSPWLFPSLSILIFSVAQWENWVWGFAINGYIAVLCTLSVIIILSSKKLSWLRLSAALTLTTISIFSSPAGFVLWIVGLLIILAMHRSALRDVAYFLLTWLITLLIIIYLYFIDYTPYSIPGGFDQDIRSQPLAYIRFFLNYLGNPLLSAEYSWLVGLAGLVAYLYLPWTLIRSKVVTYEQLQPYLAIGLFVIGIAILTAYGRVGHNDGLSSRYVTISLWFWAGILVMLYLKGSAPERQPWNNWMVILGYAILAFAMVLSSNVLGMEWHYHDMPLWPWFALAIFISAIVTRYMIASKRNHHNKTPISAYIALFIAVMSTEASMRHGKANLIWYQYRHITPAIDLITASKDPMNAPDKALKTLSPEFPPEITRQRLIVLARYKLAAYREDD